MSRIILFIGLLLVTAGCNRSDNPTINNGPLVENSWRVGNTTFNALRVTIIPGSSISTLAASDQATGVGANNLYVYYKGLTPDTGSYAIGKTPDTHQIFAEALLNYNNRTYHTSGSDNMTATVTLVNGKIHLVIPETWAVDYVNHDSLKVSANLVR